MIVIYAALAVLAYIFVGGFIYGLIETFTDKAEIIDREVWTFIWPLCLVVLFLFVVGWAINHICNYGVKLCKTMVGNSKDNKRGN